MGMRKYTSTIAEFHFPSNATIKHSYGAKHSIKYLTNAVARFEYFSTLNSNGSVKEKNRIHSIDIKFL